MTTPTKGQLPKAYLRLDPNIDQVHPEDLEGFVRLLCVAARQQRRGRFRERATLDAIFGKRLVDRFMARRDIIPEDDHWYVDGWEEWQEGDWTVSERKARIRSRHDRSDTVPEPYPDRAAAVPPPLRPRQGLGQQGSKAVRQEIVPIGTLSPVRDGLPNISPEVQTIGESLTGRLITTAGEAQLTELDRLVEDHGPDAVVSAMQSVGAGTWRQVVWGAMKRLEPIPGAPPPEDQRKKDAEESERRRWEKSMAENRRRADEMGMGA
jgi:hypothetical protein